ncbi:outer membrane lipoprotein-sorting protein [candidate division KSB1 bacterium]|nr:outer membrane lipoprotein-sorting protein [candidate division KSB1 bacterium]
MRRLLIFVLLVTCWTSWQAYGQEITADQIITKVNDLMNQKSMVATVRMTIVTSSGKTRTFEYESWSKDSGEKNLMRYTTPARVKGQAILMLNNADDIWAYFPRTQRTRKLATHAKKQQMEDSDFTYEDMGSGNAFITDFIAKRLQDDKMQDYDCYRIELTKKPDIDSHYSRLIMYIIKSNFVPVVIDYYDENDPSLWLKRLVQSDILTIDDIPTAMKMVMQNQQDRTETSMELADVKYNVELDDAMFTERGLKE